MPLLEIQGQEWFVGLKWKTFTSTTTQKIFENAARKEEKSFRTIKLQKVSVGASWDEEIGKTPIFAERIIRNYAGKTLVVCKKVDDKQCYIFTLQNGVPSYDQFTSLQNAHAIVDLYIHTNSNSSGPLVLFSDLDLEFSGADLKSIGQLHLNNPVRGRAIITISLLLIAGFGVAGYQYVQSESYQNSLKKSQLEAEQRVIDEINQRKNNYLNGVGYQSLFGSAPGLEIIFSAPTQLDGWQYKQSSCEQAQAQFNCVIEYSIDDRAKHIPNSKALQYSILGKVCKFGAYNPSLKSVSCTFSIPAKSKPKPFTNEDESVLSIYQTITDRYSKTTDLMIAPGNKAHAEDWTYNTVELVTKEPGRLKADYFPNFNVLNFKHDPVRGIFILRGQYATK